MNLTTLLFFCVLFLLTSCNGQTVYSKKHSIISSEIKIKGDTVKQLGNSIMVIYQDKKQNYWFGSWETGIYKFDGKILINYNTKHGLPSNRIDEIQEDKFGNLYFICCSPISTITKFDGKIFNTLSPISSTHWKLDSTDMWFRNSYLAGNKVFRYDGFTLFELKLPNPPKLSNPYEIYTIYKDRKGNIWFGTNPVGVCRYNGKIFEWITEEDVTEFRNEGANGVRSIAEDKNGDFWFNTEFRYSIYDSATLKSKKFYSRIQSIGGLDGKKESNLDEYLSTVIDRDNHLWFVTYLDGVWKYDGKKITHYTVWDNSKKISLFSIYRDKKDQLWLGTHENGVYKFNGQTFEKFKP